jgi:hypothetical protein
MTGFGAIDPNNFARKPHRALVFGEFSLGIKPHASRIGLGCDCENPANPASDETFHAFQQMRMSGPKSISLIVITQTSRMLANPMRSTYCLAFLALILVPVSSSIQGQQSSTVIAVDTAHPGAAISPTMFGIFFEDINAGEYAAQTSGVARPDNHNNWTGAIAEAAFMTGLERNGDVVRMASYAPLLAHVDAWQWTPDAIWFDNLLSYGTPNYYVQRIFASNVGTRILPVTPQAQDGLYISASLDERSHELIVKVVNVASTIRAVEIDLNGANASRTAKVTTLESTDLNAENSFDHPKNVAPMDSTLEVKAGKIPVQLDPYSVTVYRVPVH